MACNPATLIQEAQCLFCQVPPGMVGYAILSQICTITDAIGPVSGDARITEASEDRITEAGDTRIVE